MTMKVYLVTEELAFEGGRYLADVTIRVASTKDQAKEIVKKLDEEHPYTSFNIEEFEVE